MEAIEPACVVTTCTQAFTGSEAVDITQVFVPNDVPSPCVVISFSWPVASLKTLVSKTLYLKSRSWWLLLAHACVVAPSRRSQNAVLPPAHPSNRVQPPSAWDSMPPICSEAALPATGAACVLKLVVPRRMKSLSPAESVASLSNLRCVTSPGTSPPGGVAVEKEAEIVWLAVTLVKV